MAGTLGDLRRLLQDVEDEMTCFDADALIADHWDKLGITTDHVNLFGDPDDHDNNVGDTFRNRISIKEGKGDASSATTTSQVS